MMTAIVTVVTVAFLWIVPSRVMSVAEMTADRKAQELADSVPERGPRCPADAGYTMAMVECYGFIIGDTALTPYGLALALAAEDSDAVWCREEVAIERGCGTRREAVVGELVPVKEEQ